MRYLVYSMPLFALVTMISSRAVGLSEEHFQMLNRTELQEAQSLKKRKCETSRHWPIKSSIPRPVKRESFIRVWHGI